MRILHVDHATVFGGAERSVLELAVAQRDRGHEVAVAVGGQGPFTAELDAQGVERVDLGWSSRYRSTSIGASGIALARVIPDVVGAGRALRRVVRSWRPDIVHAHTRKAQLVATLALPRRPPSLVWHLRDDVPSRAPLRWVLKLAMGRADHSVAVSRWLIESYLDHSALPRSGSIGLVPSGVRTGPLRELPTPWLDGERPPVVGYIGQIARWKAPHLLVVAAEAVQQESSFRIFGSVWFPEAEERYGRWLRDRLERSRVAARITWDPATRRAADAFREIDILAHTSTSPEPFGRVLVEAMAARRPIVAFPLGSTSELLDDDSAVIADAPTARALAAAIDALIGDRDRARALADTAATRTSRFEPDQVADAMDAEYGRLTPHRPTAPADSPPVQG